MRESWGSHNGLNPSQGTRSEIPEELGEPGKTQTESRAKGSHEGDITSHRRLSYESRSIGKTQPSQRSQEGAQVESWSHGEPERSTSESRATQYESRKRRKTHLSPAS